MTAVCYRPEINHKPEKPHSLSSLCQERCRMHSIPGPNTVYAGCAPDMHVHEGCTRSEIMMSGAEMRKVGHALNNTARSRLEALRTGSFDAGPGIPRTGI
eukprot:1149812-Rhodomonas_salina.1